ncbi:unnamed protein product [Leuciscus chuanchicus]
MVNKTHQSPQAASSPSRAFSIRTAPPNAAHVSDHVPGPRLRCSGCGRSCPGELVPLGVPGVCWNATARWSQGTHHMPIFKPSANSITSERAWQRQRAFGKSQEWLGCFGGKFAQDRVCLESGPSNSPSHSHQAVTDHRQMNN